MIKENADFDQGKTTRKKYEPSSKNFSDKGKADLKNRKTNPRYGDNAMRDPSKLDEADETTSLEQLHQMLNAIPITDDEIKSGIQISDSGKQKISARLGCGPDDIDMLLNSLISKLNTPSTPLVDAFKSFMEDSTTIVHDDTENSSKPSRHIITTTKCTKCKGSGFIGGENWEPMKKCRICHGKGKVSIKESSMLLLDDDEDADYMNEINNSGGNSFNFRWKGGFATASYRGNGPNMQLRIIHVSDNDGNDILADQALKEHLLTIARHRIETEDV